MATTFATEHVPGARNLPISADLDTVHKFVREANLQLKGRHLYVYCQSDKCPWADIVATRLTCLGIENVNVLHGGIDAWRSIANKSTPKSLGERKK
jgi:3-mercaptopyruvate sulfurtransferase SseA